MKMKQVLTGLLALVFIFGVTVAATTAPGADASAKTLAIEYFELVNNGNPLEVTDWVISETDPECPTTVSEEPCRIRAYADGSHPEALEFDEIKDMSNDFTQAYSTKVTYKP